jgi:hypothetical protein
MLGVFDQCGFGDNSLICEAMRIDKAAAWLLLPLGPDGQGAAGAPLVPCSGDPSVLLGDAAYVCGTCGSDAFYSVVCRDGFLACPTSFVTDTGAVITVPSSVRRTLPARV